jgi:hypothetical protein
MRVSCPNRANSSAVLSKVRTTPLICGYHASEMIKIFTKRCFGNCLLLNQVHRLTILTIYDDSLSFANSLSGPTCILSDGLACLAAVTLVGCAPAVTNSGGGQRTA